MPNCQPECSLAKADQRQRSLNMEKLIIEIQDVSGNWLTIVRGVDPNPTNVKIRLDEAVKRSPTGRARARTERGSIVDIR